MENGGDTIPLLSVDEAQVSREPLPMSLRATVSKVIAVDSVAQSFLAELYLDIRVPMNVKDGLGLVDQARLEQDYVKWFDFLNVADNTSTDRQTVREDAQAQEWIVEWNVKAQFLESMELHNFPLDYQVLSFQFTVNRSMSGSCPVKLEARQGIASNVNIKRSSITNVWKLEPMLQLEPQLSHASESGAGRQYPIMMISAFALRRPWNYFWNVVCPMFFFVIMSAMSFCIDRKDVADRLSVSVTLVLTAAAYKFVVASMLPALGYTTLLDKYVMGCSFFLLLLVVENGLVGKYGSEEIDFMAFVVLTATFTAFNLYFACRCLCLNRERKRVAAAFR